MICEFTVDKSLEGKEVGVADFVFGGRQEMR